MKALLIQQKMIGDVLTASLHCAYLKRWNPTLEIHFVANQHTLAVLENNPNIDKVIVFKDDFKSNKRAFFSFLWEQRKVSYDMIIDFYGKIESNLTVLFTPATKKISYHKWYTSWVYTTTVKRSATSPTQLPLSLHHRNQLILPWVGKDFNFDQQPKIYLTPKEIQEAKEFLKHRDPEKKILMIAVLGSSKLKTYPLDQLAKMLCFICQNFPVQLIFNYMPHQQQEVDGLIDELDPFTKNQLLLDAAPKSLRNYLGLVSQCNAIVGNEGGAINMGKAVRVPSFAIFSPQIDKQGWHRENNYNHAVHLNDYFPALFTTKIQKKEIPALYAQFKFSLFKEKLSAFLAQLI